MDFFQKPKILTTTIIVLFVLNLGTIAFLIFHRPPMFDHPFMPPMLRMQQELSQKEGFPPPPDVRGFLEEQLNLSDKQKEEFNKLRDDHHKRMMEIQDSIKNEKDQLFDQISVNTPDEAKVNLLVNFIGEHQKQIELVNFNHFQKMRAICDDNQKEKFDKILKDVIKNIDLHQRMPGGEMQNMPPGFQHGLPPPPMR